MGSKGAAVIGAFVASAGGAASHAAVASGTAPRQVSASVGVPTMGVLISGTAYYVKHAQAWTDDAYDDHGRAGCNPVAPTAGTAITSLASRGAVRPGGSADGSTA